VTATERLYLVTLLTVMTLMVVVTPLA